MMSSTGKSLVELLVTLFLVQFFALSIFLGLRFELLSDKFTSKVHSHKLRKEIVSSILSSGIKKSRNLLGIRSMTIHPPGVINDFTNQPIRMRLTMKSNSRAISFLSLDTDLYGRVVGKDRNGKITVCFQTTDTPLHEFENFLAISPDSYHVLAGKIIRSRRDTACSTQHTYRGRLKLVDDSVFGMLIPPKDLAHIPIKRQMQRVAPLVLVPIIENYTIYIGADDSLRRLSHINGANQAMLNNIDLLSVENINAEEITIKISDKQNALTIDFPVIEHNNKLNLLDLLS